MPVNKSTRGFAADPEYRRQRAIKASLEAHSTDTLIRRLVERCACREPRHRL